MKIQSQLLLLVVLSVAMAVVTYGARAWRPPQDQASTAPKPAANAPEAEQAAIKQTALDYIEGYYEGAAERIKISDRMT
jgi:hypothetical protein